MRWTALVIRGIGVFFVFALIMKMLAPLSLDSLLTWLGAPVSAIPVVGAVVIAVEAFLGVGIMFAPGLTVMRAGAAVFLIAGAAVLSTAVLSEKPPSCGCLGAIRLFESYRAEAMFGIGRNVALVGLLAIPLSRPTRSSRGSA